MSQSRFNQVFLTQRVILLRTLQRMVNNHSTAEDLLQETYLRVTRALSERPIDHLEPFVYQTARNLALDHLHTRERICALEPRDSGILLTTLRSHDEIRDSGEVFDLSHARSRLRGPPPLKK